MPGQNVPTSEWRADAEKSRPACRLTEIYIFSVVRGVAAIQARSKCVFHTQKYFCRVGEARRRVPDSPHRR